MKPTFTQFRDFRIIVFGQYSCNQCTAKSKRSGVRCLAPAVKSKSVCRMHGGKSTGPKTFEGLLRSSISRVIHGTQTRKVRLENKTAMLAIRALEKSAFDYGITWGPKMRGRKPK